MSHEFLQFFIMNSPNLTGLNLESRHSQLVEWWGTMYENAEAAYRAYLAMPPLQRSNIRPTNDRFTAVSHQVERYMRRHILRTVPKAFCVLDSIPACQPKAVLPTVPRHGPGQIAHHQIVAFQFLKTVPCRNGFQILEPRRMIRRVGHRIRLGQYEPKE